MALDEMKVSRYLQSSFGQYEDSIQEAWVEILERNPQTLDELAPIARKVKNKAIRRYLEKKYREESLQKPLGSNGDERFTLESILASPTNENSDETDEGSNGLYTKIVDFLIGEYLRQKTENLELKGKEIQLKVEKLRLREEYLTFKKERFESWRNLMEEKGRQKETQIKLRIQLQRERLEFQRGKLLFKKKAKGAL